MAGNKVELCGVNTAKLPLLKEEEKEELFARIKEGDEDAREQYIKGNLRLVLSVIKRFSSSSENADDLFQIGCVGLMKAVDHFDPSRLVKFSTYAVPMIIGEIRRYLRDNNSLRVSRSLRDTAYKVLQMKDQLSIELQRDPTNEEIAAAIGVEPIDVVLSVEAISDPVSIFSPIYNDGGDTIHLIDQIRDDSITDEKWSVKLMLEEGFKRLGKREKRIIHDRYFMGKTQMEIAAEIGISQAQVSRLEKNALQIMEEMMKS